MKILALGVILYLLLFVAGNAARCEKIRKFIKGEK